MFNEEVGFDYGVGVPQLERCADTTRSAQCNDTEEGTDASHGACTISLALSFELSQPILHLLQSSGHLIYIAAHSSYCVRRCRLNCGNDLLAPLIELTPDYLALTNNPLLHLTSDGGHIHRRWTIVLRLRFDAPWKAVEFFQSFYCSVSLIRLGLDISRPDFACLSKIL